MKILARKLRKNSTEAEQTLWYHLRDRRLMNFKFRRQVVINSYIVDFICFDAKLIIEADAGQHCNNQVSDKKRTKYLERLGYRVIRFWNHEIIFETKSVLSSILDELNRSPHPNPSP
ncbi:MAG: DUF559 domain-containing protein [Candidatus Thiodiazotropha sp. L084R]